jgi:hypothetical protein
VLVYVAVNVQIPFVAGDFLTHWSNAGFSVALLFRNRDKERERERERIGVLYWMTLSVARIMQCRRIMSER